MGTDRFAIFILGLMHSGTTIFWRAFRNDKRFMCFDEPFSGLESLHGNIYPNSRAELAALVTADPVAFWSRYAPLNSLDELDPFFEQKQQQYLNFLISQSDRIVIDETRLHMHLPALVALDRETYIIHLHRKARAFVTSHLRPSLPDRHGLLRAVQRYVQNSYNKRDFWGRMNPPPRMKRDEVIGYSPSSKFGLLLTENGYDTNRIFRESAVVQLLSYWIFHYRYIEHEGPRLFGNHFYSLPYEAFANDPRGTMSSLYDWIDMRAPGDMSYAQVHRPKPPHRPFDKRWKEAARIAGFTQQDIETLL